MASLKKLMLELQNLFRAPDVYFVDDVAKNLTAESVRGQKMKCNCCGKKGAALGCCLKRCKKSYHYPCARSLKCKWDEVRMLPNSLVNKKNRYF
jgi:hypothetical protein